MTELLVLPFYLVVDVSYSMTMAPKPLDGRVGEPPIRACNSIAKNVKMSLEAAPVVADKVRFSMIDFSDDAQILIPMCDLADVPPDDIPDLSARGGTSYVAAFDLLRRQIPIDVATLKGDGHKVHRPAVFFLTDGEPTDDDSAWKTAFAILTDPSFKERPNFIPFGVAEASKETLDHLVYPQGRMRSFVARQGEDPAAAIKEMADKLVGSVLASATSIHSGGDSGTFVLPEDEEDDEKWL